VPMAPAAGGGAELFSPRATRALVACWVCFWVLGHFVFWPLWVRDRCWILACRPSPLDRYRRRLCRSQVYCLLAVVGGVHLLCLCRWQAHDLLYMFSRKHQVLFSMAAAHWIVAIWEDIKSQSFLHAGLGAFSTLDREGKVNISVFLMCAYIVHHFVACCCFLLVLHFRTCTGLGAFGLMFEAPVLLMNHREFAVCAATPPKWFRSPLTLKQFWQALMMLFWTARGSASMTYLYSLVYWRADLNRMSVEERVVYHYMAIFFTMLNWSLASSFLIGWAREDRKKAVQEEEARRAAELQEAGGAGEEGAELEEEPASDREEGGNPNYKKLTTVPEHILEEKRAAGSGDSEVWLEVDGVAYDVTDFLREHPGGETVLRKYAGRDASEGFHRVRHSMRAKKLMQKYAVGPIVKSDGSMSQTCATYRLFEHVDLMGKVLSPAFRLAISYLLVAHVLPRYSAFAGLAPPEGASLAASAVPGLLLALMGGGTAMVFFIVLLLVCDAASPHSKSVSRLGASSGPTTAGPRGSLNRLWSRASFAEVAVPDRLSCGAVLYGVCVVLHIVAFTLAHQPLPAGTPSSCPTAIELGAWACFFILEAVQLTREAGHRCRQVLASFGLAAASWVQRGALSGLPASHGLAALLLAASTAVLCHRSGRWRPRKVVITEVLVGAALSGLFSAVGLYCLSSVDPTVRQAVVSWWPTSLSAFVAPEAIACLMLGTMMVLVDTSNICTGAWGARCLGFWLSAAAGLAGGVFSWRWLAWLAWLGYVTILGDRVVERQKASIANGTFKDLPLHDIGTRNMWDCARCGVTGALWWPLMHLVKAAANWVLPEELTFFAMKMPIFDLGDDVDLGVAAYYAPSAALKATKAPEHFVCNVGHVDLKHPGGVADLQKNMNAVRDIWAEFKKPTKGLLANIICFFPRVGHTSFAKQVNLTCWQSGSDAQAWYSQSEAHREIMVQHASGGLRTFGNLLATLKPHGAIRHQDRCRQCARLVEAEQPGQHAPRRCQTCGAKSFGHPWF